MAVCCPSVSAGQSISETAGYEETRTWPQKHDSPVQPSWGARMPAPSTFPKGGLGRELHYLSRARIWPEFRACDNLRRDEKKVCVIHKERLGDQWLSDLSMRPVVLCSSNSIFFFRLFSLTPPPFSKKINKSMRQRYNQFIKIYNNLMMPLNDLWKSGTCNKIHRTKKHVTAFDKIKSLFSWLSCLSPLERSN